MNKLFIASVLLMKKEGSTTIFKNLSVNGICHNEDEARGSLIKEVFDEYPGYSISNIVIQELTRERLEDGGFYTAQAAEPRGGDYESR